MSAATALLMATRSEGKLREIRPMFAAAGLTLVSLDELDIEAGRSARMDRDVDG